MPAAKRKPMTPHQREVLARLTMLSIEDETNRSWVPLELIGSRTACEHLVRKGYAESLVERGKRGGKVAFYRPTPRAVMQDDLHRAPPRSAFPSLDEPRA